MTLLADGAHDGDVLWPVIGVGSLLITGLVLARMAGILRTVEGQAVQLAALARSASALAQAEDALAWGVDALFAARVRPDGDALFLDPAGLPPELVRRLFIRCLRTLEPAAEPRGDQVAAATAALVRGATSTLCGVRCAGGVRFRFAQAPTRRAADPDAGKPLPI